jgi:catechol 2,3-dioxygenase-like lactoylglutathione lyase family enzyme
MEKPQSTGPSTQLLAAVPQFAVQDVVRTAEYYRDVLGFHIVSYWDGERRTLTPTSPPPFGIVQRDDVQLFFYRAGGRIERDEGGYHAYFHVKGVDALGQEWRSRGANILDGPEDMVYGQREIVIKDPNGLILAFGEATSGPSQ